LIKPRVGRKERPTLGCGVQLLRSNFDASRDELNSGESSDTRVDEFSYTFVNNPTYTCAGTTNGARYFRVRNSLACSAPSPTYLSVWASRVSVRPS